MAFTFEQKALFKHYDPAGIVFYPRYYEMMNDGVETDNELSWPYGELHGFGGVSRASISTKFTASGRRVWPDQAQAKLEETMESYYVT